MNLDDDDDDVREAAARLRGPSDDALSKMENYGEFYERNSSGKLL